VTATPALTPGPDETPALTRRALRKASLRLIPLIALGYGTAYMDRVNISFAALQMNRELHFSATVYGLGAGLFFLSYAACEIPSNLLLYRFGARRWLSRIMITWGLIAMAMIFVRTPLQFYAARFLLGIAEAGFFPGVVFYLMQWFPTHLRARTITRFYISFPLASVFMGAAAGALLNLQGRLWLAGWQWLFLVEALPALLLGIAFLLYLPDSPQTAPWLTEPERQAILAGVQQSSIPTTTHTILPTLRNPRTLLVGAFMFCMLASSYAYQFSAPAILKKSTGLSDTRIGLILSAISLVSALAMLLNGHLSDRLGERYWTIIPHCLLVAAGFLLCGLSNAPWAILTGISLIVIPYAAFQGPLLAIPATFLSGRSLAAGIAAMNTIGILGGFIGPYWMGLARDLTGSYQRGLLTMTAPMLLAAAIILYLRHTHSPLPSKPN
jgi:ACS family tartrate transporter-like MFS transporter